MTSEFHFGPGWAAGSGCCGKPIGCTNVSDGCLMLNHPWKRRNVIGTGEDRPDRLHEQWRKLAEDMFGYLQFGNCSGFTRAGIELRLRALSDLENGEPGAHLRVTGRPSHLLAPLEQALGEQHPLTEMYREMVVSRSGGVPQA